MGWPCCTTLPLCFVFLVIIETVYCTWKICKFSQLLRTILFLIPFLWRVTVHSVEDCILLILPKRNFPTDHDCGENHYRCLRIRMATANREEYGSSVAEWQPWFFSLLSGSEPDTSSCRRIWVLQVPNNTSMIQHRSNRSSSKYNHSERKRTSSQHLTLCSPFFPKWLQTLTYILFQEKRIGEENLSFQCLKKKKRSISGMDGWMDGFIK